MGKTEGQARRIKISDKVLYALAALIVLSLIGAIVIIPGYGKVFTKYRENRAEWKKASAALEAAQAENADLHQEVEDLTTMTADIEATRTETFKLASQLEQDILDGKSNKKICYLTLDDGPYNRGKEYLKLFKKYDIKATFFLTTANGNKLPDQGDLTAASMYPEYLKYGHTIGNHTYSHNYSDGGIYSSSGAFMKSVEKQQEFTKEATGGYTPEIVRFPGGTSMAYGKLGDIENALSEKGDGWIDWTVDSGDSWGGDKVTTELIKKNVIDASRKHKILVVLCHEWSQKSLEAMPEIIETLESEGYIFLPLFKDSVMVNK